MLFCVLRNGRDGRRVFAPGISRTTAEVTAKGVPDLIWTLWSGGLRKGGTSAGPPACRRTYVAAAVVTVHTFRGRNS
jgi:hypothetical protein